MPHGSKRKILWLALIFGFFFSGNAWAGPVLKDRHFPADIYEGQAIKLKLVFEWPAGEGEYEIKSPESVDLENIKFVGLSQAQKTSLSSSGPVSQLTLTYELLPLQTGQGSIDPFVVLYRKPGQGAWKKIPVTKLILEMKPALPWKGIRVLLLILAALVVPVALWFIHASWAEREREKNFKIDPKQQLYADAVKKFNGFICGYTTSYLRTLLSEWSDELTKVVMAYYDIPIRPATQTEIFKELGARNIPAGELQEIKGYFHQIEHLEFSLGNITSDTLEETRLLLLQYANSKIIVENQYS